jgi:hypothetical protein
MNYFDPKHPHEPEISPQFDADGRCLICLMICERDNAIRELNIEKKIAQKVCLEITRLERQRDEAREQNAKLRDIAERAIIAVALWAGSRTNSASELRAELEHLKETKLFR